MHVYFKYIRCCLWAATLRIAHVGMLSHMRTTINLPEGLGEEAKRHAAQRWCTFTARVVEGLHLVPRHSAEGVGPGELPRP